MKIKELRELLAKTLKAAQDVAAKAEAEGRDFTAEERTVVTTAMTEAQGIKAKIDQAQADEKMANDLAAMGRDLGLTGGDVGSTGTKGAPTLEQTVEGLDSAGAQFVKSDEYATLLKSAAGGVISDRARVGTPPVRLKGRAQAQYGTKALVTGLSDTSAGALVRSDWLGIQDEGVWRRPLRLLDVITTAQTDTDVIEYARITGVTNNAAPVAEATTAAGPSANTSTGVISPAAGAGVKPESAMTFDTQSTTVRTIAHWMPVTKRALSDASQIRSMIDEFLRYGLQEELEDQVLLGSGSGENFTGINNTSGIQTQAFATDMVTTLRAARSKVLGPNARRRPNAILMNPADADNLALLKDGNGQYVFGGPAMAGGATQVWGLPVVELEGVPTGFAFVGDFKRAVLWNREQTSLSVSDSHADFFIRNIVAILAELRAAFTVLQPAAIVKADIVA